MSIEIPYQRASGIGNKFLIIDCRKTTEFSPSSNDTSLFYQSLCQMIDLHTGGLECDQIILLSHSQDPTADIAVSFINSDGSSSGACGNGLRCAAQLFFQETQRNFACIQTEKGKRFVERATDDNIKASCGRGYRRWGDIPLSSSSALSHLPAVPSTLGKPFVINVGNPHIIFFTNDVQSVDVKYWGPIIENHPAFPERINVGFAQIISASEIKLTVWERGAGLTQACGTGACAVVALGDQEGVCDKTVLVHQAGGDLSITIDEEGYIWMTGPAELGEKGVWKQS